MLVIVFTTVSFFCVAKGRVVNERSEGVVLYDPVIGVEVSTIMILLLLTGTGNGA